MLNARRESEREVRHRTSNHSPCLQHSAHRTTALVCSTPPIEPEPLPRHRPSNHCPWLLQHSAFVTRSHALRFAFVGRRSSAAVRAIRSSRLSLPRLRPSPTRQLSHRQRATVAASALAPAVVAVAAAARVAGRRPRADRGKLRSAAHCQLRARTPRTANGRTARSSRRLQASRSRRRSCWRASRKGVRPTAGST